ncbi:MAG: Ig-like domain-containing protein, partial [Leptospiraceae bacterium]|nr:Ig-like domain-containing protein [Leptospiraceae bacterium]
MLMIFCAGMACDRAADIPELLLLPPAEQRPRIIGSNPAPTVGSVAPDTEIYVDFDRPMDLEATRNAFVVTGSAPPSGTPRWS